VHVRLLS